MIELLLIATAGVFVAIFVFVALRMRAQADELESVRELLKEHLHATRVYRTEGRFRFENDPERAVAEQAEELERILEQVQRSSAELKATIEEMAATVSRREREPEGTQTESSQ